MTIFTCDNILVIDNVFLIDFFRIEDLEASLLLNDAKTASDVLRICKGKPINENIRPVAWEKCLNVNHGMPNASLSEIFDLPEQKLLRLDCQQFVGKNFLKKSTLVSCHVRHSFLFLNHFSFLFPQQSLAMKMKTKCLSCLIWKLF